MPMSLLNEDDMAAMKIRRNASAPKGFLRRVKDAGFERVGDRRKQPWVIHPLATPLLDMEAFDAFDD